MTIAATGQTGPAEAGGRRYRLVRATGPAEPAPILDDPVQRSVIEHTSGPLLVLGGPGTGKTTTLVESVAARVASGVAPQRILTLTFGRRGAARLRDQVEIRVNQIGQRTARAVTTTTPLVRTFHAYAFGLLWRAAVAAGEPVPRLLTGPEQDMVIREMLERGGGAGADDPIGWPASLRPALRTRAFTTALRDLLLRAIERDIGPSGLAGLAAAHGRPDWAAAARFYAEYLQVLALRDTSGGGSVGYDYAELVRAATRLLREDPGRLAAERRGLAHVYVDELADTDPAQVELLAMIAGGGGNLVAFADPDSSTFAFRGADPGIIQDFQYRFRTAAGAVAPRVTLTRSYRSGAELLAATRRVAARLRGPARHRQLDPASVNVDPRPRRPADAPADPGTPAGIRGARVEVRTFRTEAAEAAHVARRLREARLLDGVPWSRMAVIVRSTVPHLAPVQRALLQAGVPVTTHAEDLPLHRQPAIGPMMRLLRCALDPELLDEDTAVFLLHSPLAGADPLAERRLRHGLRALALAAGDPQPSGVLLVEALREPTELAAVERRWAAPAQTLAGLLAAAREAVAKPGASAEDVLWSVWHRSGLAERWTAASRRGGHRGAAADRDLDAVVALFDAAARYVDRLPGAGLRAFLDHVEGQDIPSDSIAPAADRGPAVRIVTAHAAKGLEWDVVAIVGVQEGVWPDLRLRGTVLGSGVLVDAVAGREMETVGRLSALLDEERRLFYVAASRARQRLIVTAVAAGDGEEQPSRFLDELRGAGSDDGQPGGAGSDDGQPGGPGFDDRLGGGRVTPRTTDVDDGAAPALTLPALVARLRIAVLDPDAPDERRAAAAGVLAQLAAHGVPGADPDQWWGLPELSDERPLGEPGQTVRISPSTIDSVRRCSLRWLLERHGGGNPASPEQSIGNLVHAAAMLATDASVDRAALAAYVAERFEAIELSARWLAGRERERAEAMLGKLLGWLAGNPRRLVGIEREFLVELADPDAPVEIRGRVDRLEVDPDGRLVVVDLKTGKSAPAGSELAEHGQLAAYQVAVEAGAFEESTRSGGAALVQLGTPTVTAREQVQRPLVEADDPTWAYDLVRATAKTMAAATFEAVASNRCRVCPVTTSCPVSGKGGQITCAGNRDGAT